jgi:hypothetical protein
MEKRHVGWGFGSPNENEIDIISKEVTRLTHHLLGRPIIVNQENISSLLDSYFNAFEPHSGDIFTRYSIPKDSFSGFFDFDRPHINPYFRNQVIAHIVKEIENDFEMRKRNESFSAWNYVEGRLSQHPPIKLRLKRPKTMEFHMR